MVLFHTGFGPFKIIEDLQEFPDHRSRYETAQALPFFRISLAEIIKIGLQTKQPIGKLIDFLLLLGNRLILGIRRTICRF
mgnify:CR=1 FL=1